MRYDSISIEYVVCAANLIYVASKVKRKLNKTERESETSSKWRCFSFTLRFSVIGICSQRLISYIYIFSNFTAFVNWPVLILLLSSQSRNNDFFVYKAMQYIRISHSSLVYGDFYGQKWFMSTTTTTTSTYCRWLM